MTRPAIGAGLIACALMLSAAPGATAKEITFAKHEEQTLRRDWTFGAAAGRSLVVDGFEGSISLEGTSGDRVEAVIHETVRADTAEDIARARREVRLEVSRQGEAVRLYVDGPFRSPDGGTDFHGWRRQGYEVRHDFELRVPLGTDVVLRTVLGGEVVARGLRGRFEVANVNGGVEVTGAAGSGSARAVNGPVKVVFSDNPTGDCDFATVNGAVDVSFRRNLGADVRFKTLNGDAYTDFRATSLPAGPPTWERRKGATVYRIGRGSAVRIGAGGPQLSFETVNGDILIRDRDRQEASR